MTDNSNNTEQIILDAAERLFLRKGFNLTSTTEIAREAGCNQSLVHYYFRTKEKLFASIYEKKIILFLADFVNGSKRDLPFREKVKSMIEAHFDMLMQNPQLSFFLLTELVVNERRFDTLRQSMSRQYMNVYDMFQSELNTEIAKGNIRPLSAPDLVITIISLNDMLFLASPLLKKLFGDNETYDSFIKNRRNENVRIIMQSLNP